MSVTASKIMITFHKGYSLSSPLTNVQRLNNITFGLDDNGEHGDDSGHGGPARSSADIFEEVCNQRAGTLPALSGRV